MKRFFFLACFFLCQAVPTTARAVQPEPLQEPAPHDKGLIGEFQKSTTLAPQEEDVFSHYTFVRSFEVEDLDFKDNVAKMLIKHHSAQAIPEFKIIAQQDCKEVCTAVLVKLDLTDDLSAPAKTTPFTFDVKKVFAHKVQKVMLITPQKKYVLPATSSP